MNDEQLATYILRRTAGRALARVAVVLSGFAVRRTLAEDERSIQTEIRCLQLHRFTEYLLETSERIFPEDWPNA